MPSWHGETVKAPFRKQPPCRDAAVLQVQQGAQLIAGLPAQSDQTRTPALLLHALGQQPEPLSDCAYLRNRSDLRCAVIGRQRRDPAQNRLDKQSGSKRFSSRPDASCGADCNRNQDLLTEAKRGVARSSTVAAERTYVGRLRDERSGRIRAGLIVTDRDLMQPTAPSDCSTAVQTVRLMNGRPSRTRSVNLPDSVCCSGPRTNGTPGR